MGKEVKIIIPDDCELVQTGEGKWEQRKIESKLPKTWKEFCETHPVQKGECFIGMGSIIIEAGRARTGREDSDKLMLPNKETAEAFLALMQLIQLMNCYNGDWKPDWSDRGEKHVIHAWSKHSEVVVGPDCEFSDTRILVFKTEELRDQFLENFKDLIEIAKPLI